MSVQVSYPGVYIQEIPSGNNAITGVATSITAFFGRAPMGPWDPNHGPVAVSIGSFAEYARTYGGLSHSSPMSYAVQDFFMNGGSQAIIVRLYQPPQGPSPSGSPAQGSSGVAQIPITAPHAPGAGTGVAAPAALTIEAASPGVWGNSLYARVDVDGMWQDAAMSKPNAALATVAAQYGLTVGDLFNLTVFYRPPTGPLAVERYLGVTVKTVAGYAPNPNRLDRVLQRQSQLVGIAAGTLPGSVPAAWLSAWSKFNADPNVQKLTQNQIISLLPGVDPKNPGADSSLPTSDETYIDALTALDPVDLFNLMCIPPDSFDADQLDRTPSSNDTSGPVYAAAASYCQSRRAILIADPPGSWAAAAKSGDYGSIDPSDLEIEMPFSRNAAVYFPRVVKADPLANGVPTVFPACGLVAGAIAATDFGRGVWKAPAGVDTGISGISGLEVKMNDAQNGVLNPIGINCLRTFPVIGSIVWGARTLAGADILSDDYKYLNVRRLTLFVEESLYRGTKWAVFEPNAEPLWASLRTSVGSFLADLQRQGALYSYFVTCDATTTTQTDIDLGIVNVVVGIAPVKPAEFVVITIQQTAGQAAT